MTPTLHPEDGSYYAKGIYVCRHPLRTETGTQLGFVVCTCNEFVDGAAIEIAKALNAAETKRKERA